ncbi:MAG TPA: hypothetical protein VNL16_16715 [Chloroflexota bacterium]|nr:hypothetical protein [Chloroflexota bacterium]
MYSPKIPERLIPPLYQMAQTRRQPMTLVVAEILDAYLANQSESAGDRRDADSPPDPTEVVGLRSAA